MKKLKKVIKGYKKVDEDLKIVKHLLDTNESKLDIGKTKYTIFHPATQSLLRLQPNLVKLSSLELDIQHFLKHYLDENLNWKYHLSNHERFTVFASLIH